MKNQKFLKGDAFCDAAGKNIFFIAETTKNIIRVEERAYNVNVYILVDYQRYAEYRTVGYEEYSPDKFSEFISENDLENIQIWISCIDRLVRLFDWKPSEALKNQVELNRRSIYHLIAEKEKQVFPATAANYNKTQMRILSEIYPILG